MAQQRLVIELKLAIDRSDWRSVADLIANNPRSAWAKHVQRNVGVRRARWMSIVRDEALVTPRLRDERGRRRADSMRRMQP